MGELASRRSQTQLRIAELKRELAEAETIAADKACVYATGSFGRVEASEHSDLDLFIVGDNASASECGKVRPSALRRLDEIRIKADLIEATSKLGIREFSGDGKYLTHYSVDELTKTLGQPHDDVENTFTARLLLLLESQPLIGKGVYDKVIADVISAYWRDFADHKSDFVPAFLANDILRLWRTFCVNYEARTLTEPEEEKAKRKVKNYKLKHSRMLTCYSALLCFLAELVNSKTVSPTDAIAIVNRTPTERLEWIRTKTGFNAAHETITKLLDHYERFLSTTNVPEAELNRRFMEKAASKSLMREASNFGDLMFEALRLVGGEHFFFRFLMV